MPHSIHESFKGQHGVVAFDLDATLDNAVWGPGIGGTCNGPFIASLVPDQDQPQATAVICLSAMVGKPKSRFCITPQTTGQKHRPGRQGRWEDHWSLR